MTQKERYQRTIEYFSTSMPEAESELHFESPFQLVVAVVLSAQCTDQRVNQVTPTLFAAYPSPEAMAAASEAEIYSLIRSISYPNNKSKHLKGLAQMLVDEFGSVVPSELEQLQRLPGVGRKTANVVRAVYFDQPAMPVDTHVFRVAERIGLATGCRTPRATEQQLVRHIPTHLLSKAHHWLLLHGRYVCTARRPHCAVCGLTEVCRHYARQQKGGTDAIC